MGQDRSREMMDKVGRNLSLIALVVLLVLVPFESKFEAIYQAAEAVIAVGFILRLVREVRWYFWVLAVAITAASMGLFIGIAAICVRLAISPFPMALVAKSLLVNITALYFCMVLVFLSQFVFRPEGWKMLDRWTKITLALVWAFSIVVLISAICSLHPIESLGYVRKLAIPYLLVYTIAVESLHSWRHYRIVVTAIYLVGIIVTSAAVTTRYLYLYGGHDLQRDFLKNEIVWERKERTGEVFLRNQWPFRHHNRLCTYALLVSMFVWLQFFVTRNWELKTLVAISTVIPVWCMMTTLTRGGWIALAAGALALILMINWRTIWVFLAVVAAVWLISPPMARERLTSIFKLSTYRDEKSSARWRLQIWQWTADVIKHYPVLGLGAGWEVYENYVKTHYDVKPGIETPQAHNNFLEVAAESGLGAAALFAAFTAALVVQISRAWRGTQRQTKRRFVVAGFFALLIAITVHGMSSYSLRYTIGMLVWICFALLTLLPMIARAIPEEAAQAPPSA